MLPPELNLTKVCSLVVLRFAACYFELAEAAFFVRLPVGGFQLTAINFCQFAARVVQSKFACFSGHGSCQSIAFKFAMLVIYYYIIVSNSLWKSVGNASAVASISIHRLDPDLIAKPENPQRSID